MTFTFCILSDALNISYRLIPLSIIFAQACISTYLQDLGCTINLNANKDMNYDIAIQQEEKLMVSCSWVFCYLNIKFSNN